MRPSSSQQQSSPPARYPLTGFQRWRFGRPHPVFRAVGIVLLLAGMFLAAAYLAVVLPTLP